MKKKTEPTIVVGYDLGSGIDRSESELAQFYDMASNNLESIVKKIGTELMGPDVPHIARPKFTVRGEHNVWHVYENEERLEPPFRNQERAEIERAHHERCHAIRKGYNQEPNKGV